ncbi:MAG TPA: substrate-binding domain-containing protein, partial [Puia sp.]|nr:substrate-binding domain-containing protein [Puia sp.]
MPKPFPMLLAVTTLLLAAKPPAASAQVLVAAAADLRFAMDSLVDVFSRVNPGITVKPTYGSSGNFFEQIRNGAPFDIF